MTKDLRFKNKKENVGFTLLYASMIAGLLLAIGAAILSITVKQISLSAAGRESQFAFYNADTGTECAVYWYRTSKTGICPAGLFPPKSDSTNDQSCTNISSNPPKCLGLALTDKYGGQITSFAQTGLYSFSITSQGANNICFDVTIDKNTDPSKTIITSRGYNTCDKGNRFERAIEVDF